jgi:hypothetical protein
MNLEMIPRIWLFIAGAVYFVGLMVCLGLAPVGFTVGFGCGGALVLTNAWISARKVRQADFPNKSRVIVSLVGGYYLRLIFLGVCLYGFIKFGQVDPVGLITGLSVMPAGLLVMLILIYIANRRPEEA